MKYLLSLLLLTLMVTSFNVNAQCDPRYYDPATCQPYYTPRYNPNQGVLPNNPYHTRSRSWIDYTTGRDMVGINNRYYGGTHYHDGNCNHYYDGRTRQQQYSRWGIYGNVGGGSYGRGGLLGFHYEGGRSRQR